MAMRKFVALACHNGEMDYEHEVQYDDAKEKFFACVNCMLDEDWSDIDWKWM